MLTNLHVALLAAYNDQIVKLRKYVLLSEKKGKRKLTSVRCPLSRKIFSFPFIFYISYLLCKRHSLAIIMEFPVWVVIIPQQLYLLRYVMYSYKKNSWVAGIPIYYHRSQVGIVPGVVDRSTPDHWTLVISAIRVYRTIRKCKQISNHAAIMQQLCLYARC